jgi:hypothetical protein
VDSARAFCTPTSCAAPVLVRCLLRRPGADTHAHSDAVLARRRLTNGLRATRHTRNKLCHPSCRSTGNPTCDTPNGARLHRSAPRWTRQHCRTGRFQTCRRTTRCRHSGHPETACAGRGRGMRGAAAETGSGALLLLLGVVHGGTCKVLRLRDAGCEGARRLLRQRGDRCKGTGVAGFRKPRGKFSFALRL